jgi:hypothetical protein
LLQNLKNKELNASEYEEIECYKYVLQTILPFLRRINDEQMIEKEMEAKIQGIFFRSLSNKLRNSSVVQILLVSLEESKDFLSLFRSEDSLLLLLVWVTRRLTSHKCKYS